jgi:hypothetical protein
MSRLIRFCSLSGSWVSSCSRSLSAKIC